MILDLMVGGPEEGWLILTLLRNDPVTAELPIVLSSANVHFLRQRARLLQMKRCVALEKPFRPEALLEAITRAFALVQRSELGAG